MKKLQLAIILALAAILSACSKKASISSIPMSKGGLQETSADLSSSRNADGKEFTGTGFNPEKAADTNESKQSQLTSERKIIFSGEISLEVESLGKTQDVVNKWVKDLGGYVSDANMGASYASFTVRIPSASFEKAMEQAGSFGKVLNKRTESSDVTEEFYDLKTRLETKKVLLERLENYLKSAASVKDMMEIESKINDVTSEVERMQGQMNRLSSKVNLSTINIYASLPANHTEEGFVLPDTGRKMKALFGGLLGFIVGLIFVLLYIVFYGAPIILLVALFYWLCFGKIGILRKLFSNISNKKVKEEDKPAEKKA